MIEKIGLFILALSVILAAAVIFTNSVEWLGKRLKLSEGGVGSVLAAVGTALPETMIPLVAILWMGGRQDMDVAIGAIIGAPFMLVTLTLPMTAAWIMILSASNDRRGDYLLDVNIPKTDLGYFIPSFSLAIAATMIPFPIGRGIIALVLLGLYIHYLKTVLVAGDFGETYVPPLYFSRSSPEPGWGIILIQMISALGIMVLGAHLFVEVVGSLSSSLGMSALVLSLLITPVATELPEKFNSLVWIKRKKDGLAVGNITGAMVFQGTIPVSIGLLFTPWDLNHYSLLSAGMAITTAIIYLSILLSGRSWRPWQIVCGAIFYIAFCLYVFLQ